MKKIILLCFILLALSSINKIQAQNNAKWSVGYYSFNNDFGISYIKSSIIQPELRFKTIGNTNIEASFLLRSNGNISTNHNLIISYGLGIAVNDAENSNLFCRVPVYFVKKDVLIQDLNFMLGFEMKSDFDDYKVLPGVGVALNF